MTFVPPGEKIIEKKICRISGEDFIVTDKDLEFYDKISPVFGGKKYSIPSPTLCPDERARNRMMFRNFNNFYHRHSDLSKTAIISMYGSHTDTKVYATPEWWSDDWSAMDYGKKFDFEKNFTDNLRPLHREIPRMALMNRESENCDYANLCWMSKDCYLVSGCVRNEDCLFGHIVWKSKGIIDSLYIYESENCYQCVDCVGSHSLQHCQDCKDSRDCLYCVNCSGCMNCIGCVGLKNASYHILNQSVSQEEYKKKIQDLSGRNLWTIPFFSEKIIQLRNTTPTPHIQGAGNENITGNALYFSKNCFECFDVKRSENLKYCRTTNQFTNSHDINFSPDTSDFCYQGIAVTGTNVLFCHNCNNCSYTSYSDNCYVSQDIFGCVGLTNQHHCILNTSYSVQEYEILCGKIIDHLRTTGEWGEYLHPTLSPFGYNETISSEYYPLSEDSVMKNGWKWCKEEGKSTYIGSHYTPLSIQQYNEKVVGFDIASKNINECLNGIIQCEITQKPFKIIKQELAFYIENSIPIPTKHPDQRHKERMDLRNPRKLYEKTCAECQKEMITTYAPERLEKIVCEECYRKLVY